MITSSQKSGLKQLLQSPQWSIVQEVQRQLVNDIQDDFVCKDTEWETLRATVSREARIQGINEFINKLYEQAQ